MLLPKRKMQMFLLPFAGGNCYSYKPFFPYLNNFLVLPLELPGRGKRIAEPLLKSFEEAVNDYFYQIKIRLSGEPFVIYGHSMGAYLGFFVCKKLQEIGRVPDCLFVSGSSGTVTANKVKRHLMAEKEFINSVRDLGGLPDEVLAHKDLMEFYAPILRCDFCIIEEHVNMAIDPITAPIYAMMGDREENANLIDNWAKHTTAKFSSRILEGNHFFIFSNVSHVTEVFKSVYDKTLLF